MNDTKELAPAAEQPSTLAAILSDPQRLQDIPVETVERLYAIQRQINDDDARKAFYGAMNAVQADIRPVLRKGFNQHTRSKYAYLEEIQRMLTPILAHHGFSASTSTVQPILPDTMRVCLTIRHIGGHMEQHHMDAEIDDTGMGNKKTKTRLHGTGSTYTYCERMLLSKVFGVVLTDNPDDDDGNRSNEPVAAITDEQAANLQALAEEVSADMPKFLQYLRVDTLAELPADHYKKAVTALERKRHAD